MKLTPLPAAGRRATPWKNGGGVTREVTAFPAGADLETFDWRISIAEVHASGPFSRFPEVDRILAVLQGEMRLRTADDQSVLLTPKSEPYAFPGDLPCHGEVLAGAVDLNLMVRRGVMGRMSRAYGPALRLPTPVGVFVATQPCRVGDLALSLFDAVRLEGPGETPLHGAGWIMTIDSAAI